MSGYDEEVQKLKVWFDEQKAKGLRHVSYDFADSYYALSPEEKIRAVNEFNEAAKNAVPFCFNDSMKKGLVNNIEGDKAK